MTAGAGNGTGARAAAGASLRQSVAGCLDGAIGGHGLAPATLAAWCDRLAPALDALRADVRDARLPLLGLPRETADLVPMRAALDALSKGADTLVFFGIGGSGLGGQTLAQLAGWNIPGSATPEQRRRPRTRFYDNLDAGTLTVALSSLDPAKTRFIVTSKSGNTPETLVQAVAALTAVKAAGLSARIPELFLGITEPAGKAANGLRALFSGLGIPMLDHNPGVGGRFSVLTNVGLLPALARGLDVAAIRGGAQQVIDALMAGGAPQAFAPAEGAALAVALLQERGIRTHVMLPYADRLERFAHWFVQLWAESLGKSGHGTSPIACLGPVDQHSQLQLFMDGPRDHLITVVRAPSAGGPPLDAGYAGAAGLGFMSGHTVGELVAAQSAAVPDALARAGRPVRTLDLAALDEAGIGALLMHCMVETILVARLLGIDPFDQPAVELAKRLTRERMS